MPVGASTDSLRSRPLLLPARRRTARDGHPPHSAPNCLRSATADDARKSASRADASVQNPRMFMRRNGPVAIPSNSSTVVSSLSLETTGQSEPDIRTKRDAAPTSFTSNVEAEQRFF